MAALRGIPLSKVSPAFLHANSTSHTWVFSAFAELIDNAYDPDVSASELLIDKVDIRGHPCLIFLDNGAGMDRDHLLKMLSFGFCEKDVYEKQGSHQPIGHYGNGFKSGSMRLGKDALVFTRCQKSASIGFLSQTYLSAIQTDSVVVPILEYRLPNLERIKSQESRNNLNAILQYSIFNQEYELKEELKALEGSKTGTKIIIYNLKRLQDSTYELDFSSDPTDIRCPEAHEVDMTSIYHRPIQHNTSEYKRSLREYCSILFLRPRMKITIRGMRVKSKLISKSLSNTEIDMYKPTWLSRPVKIIFGFTCETDKSEDYGMMLYHRNRLIKAFEKVGYQKQPNDLGIGVVGVAQVDFLQPIHNKQDFNKDEKYNSVMAAFANKLNDYWNEKKNQQGTSQMQPTRVNPDWLWAQCDQCLKWRRLPDGIDGDSLPDRWYCRMNLDATHNRCDIPEEPEDEDLAVKPTYEKTFKKKQEERKRLQLIERQKEEDVKRRKIMEKEMELKEKEAALRAIQHVAATQPIQENRALTSLQKALAEARKREEQQKRLILQIQEQKKFMEEQQKKIMEEQRNSLLQMAESLQAAKGKKSKDVLEQMSHLINTFSPTAVPVVPSAPVMPQKRKLHEQTSPMTSSKSSKKLLIKTETGEEISITRNDINDDEEDSAAAQTPASSCKKQLRSKTEPLKVSLQFPPEKLSNSGTLSASTKPSNKDPTASSLSAQIEGRATASSKWKRQSKSTVVAVIDLTNESEFGELVDIKPDLDELRNKLQENLRQENDIKPDKDAIDAANAHSENYVEDKVSVHQVTETKQEVLETSQVLSTAKRKEDSGENSDKVHTLSDIGEGGIQFGTSQNNSELDIPDSYQDNLETAMAVILERMNKEKSEACDKKCDSEEQQKGGFERESGVSTKKESPNYKETDTESLKACVLQQESDVSSIGNKAVSCDKRKGEEIAITDGENEKTTDNVLSVDNNAYDSENDNEISYDFHAEDDDSDYRDCSAVDEKGDKTNAIVGKKTCVGSESSRSNSVEDGGGSSSHENNVSMIDESNPVSSNELQSEFCKLTVDKDLSGDKLSEENLSSASVNSAQNSPVHNGNQISDIVHKTETVCGETLTSGISCIEKIVTEKIALCKNSSAENLPANKDKISTKEKKFGGNSSLGRNTEAVGITESLAKKQSLIDNSHRVQDIEDALEEASLDPSAIERGSDDSEVELATIRFCEKKDLNSLQVKERNSPEVESEDSNTSEKDSTAESKSLVFTNEALVRNDVAAENDTVLDELKDISVNGLQCNSVESPAETSLPLSPPPSDCSPPEPDFTTMEDSRSSLVDSTSVSNKRLDNYDDVCQIKNQSEDRIAVCRASLRQSKPQQEYNVDRVCDQGLQTDITMSIFDMLCREEESKPQQKYDVDGLCHQGLQTDISLCDLLCRQEESQCRKTLNSQCVQTIEHKIETLCMCTKVNKLHETPSMLRTFSEIEVQTDFLENNMDGNYSDQETVEQLRTKLLLKTQVLQKTEEKLDEIHHNIHKLLGFIVPGTDLGHVSNIEQIIRDMIRVNEEASQQSQSQE